MFSILFWLGLNMASATVPSPEVLVPFQNVLKEQARYLATLEPGRPSRRCENRYEKLWQDGVLRVDWYYGYINSDDIVIDRLVRNEMIRALIRPCRGGLRGACGFRVAQDQSEQMGPIVLAKTAERGRVIIRLWNSSVNVWNRENTVGLGLVEFSNGDQLRKTKLVRDAFLRSLAGTEVVVYEGHARGGAGPGFGPYGLLQMAKAALFKNDWKRVLWQLGRSVKRPEVLMFAACKSEDYYLPTIQSRFPETSVVSTANAQSFGNNEQMVFSLVDSLVVGRCEDEINQSFVSHKGYGEGITRIHGFE